ncbi:MAG: hypothetical protein CMK83_20015 [Pseudomonadales bacterium]|jgi:hypothetical protein|uniref:DUF1214 domain-containing protein n=1 Tax=unclassified Ketobacter TaxID=2639109 RepID=UPI000C37B1AA|nr:MULTISPECIES: hypothetical protein [unclassified Ketobacter]MAQ26501.1 hypothetical protein [Pseudomonadales bacterium]MEC8812230.1 hypothetical protein [Pseudomonadota bacterium]TNC89641.1 MAG: hypothetical protein CSH49_06355 [Alcanivorax sp.]HAG94890.1 hypothetical protein [Gammaproteobacteria bacterium]MBI27195.1 hypothetical protein [Pseudomonadales bacterium]|tara:strand:+ start:17747 stop:18958 length:1212 start_codon:yes stop_codon:yes gene_type:complete
MKTAIAVLNRFRKITLWWRQLRGVTPESLAQQRILSGQSWEEFCDTLKAAGASLSFPGTPQDAFNQAEGYRYLTRLTRAGLMAFVEHADPKAPVLHRVVHETVKMGADNPDNYYQTACISGEYEYRIRGRRNSVHYLGFGTQIGHYGQGGGMPPSGYLEASQLAIDDDGCFEIIVSCQPQPNNWLPMQPNSGNLIVRQTFLDRERETPAELSIERICPPGETAVPGRVTPEQVDSGLRSTSTLVAGASLLFAKWARDFQQHSNTLPQFDPEVSTAAGGDPNIIYYHSHWALTADEALLIEVTPPQCEHWNFQLNNYWMESLDYTHFQIHTNKHLAQLEDDGSVRIIVAHQDPGLPNWINTTGHASGTMCFRWIRARQHPQPSTRVVKLSQLQSLQTKQQTATA